MIGMCIVVEVVWCGYCVMVLLCYLYVFVDGIIVKVVDLFDVVSIVVVLLGYDVVVSVYGLK